MFRSLHWVVILVGFSGSVTGAQLIVNGAFEPDLNGWSTNGAVSPSSGFALIEEAQQGGTSAIFQTVGGSGDPLLLTFDLFVDGMSPVIGTGGLPDTAFGTLYFGDIAFGSDVSAGVFDEQLALFDLDRSGLTSTVGLTVEPLAGRPGWVRVDLTFSTTRAFTTFVVEEVDLNLVVGDSVAALDNVSLFQIPEPSGSLLLLFAIGVFAAKRIRPT